MNNKGFTMVELLVSMAILALLTVMAFPTLRSIDVANTNKKMEAYGDSLVSAAKLYTDSYENDMFMDTDSDSCVVSFKDLFDKKLIKDINMSNSSCKNSSVVVAKNGDNYLYCLDLDCTKKSDEIKSPIVNPTECDNYKMLRLTYHSNSNKNQISIDKQLKTTGFILKSNPFTYTGYKFASWNTKTDGSGEKLMVGSSYKPNSNSDLFAKWCLDCKKTGIPDGLQCHLNTSNGTCDYSKTTCEPVDGYKLTGTNPSNFSCEPKTITCDPGYYLKAKKTKCDTECTAGNYCEGGPVKYNPNKDEGIKACPKGYGNSDTKSTKSTDCYMNVPKDKYVKAKKDETATSCATGYEKAVHKVYYNSTSSCTAKDVVCVAGTYLKASSLTCSDCESGHYCPGGTYKFGTSTQGRNNCPSSYGSSDAKSSVITHCFMNVAANKYIKNKKDETATNCSTGYEKAAHKVHYDSTSTCDLKNITCLAGTYLGANSVTCSDCESGYFCPGGTYTYGNAIQGRNACPSGYGSSEVKSSVNTKCYMSVPSNKYVASAGASTATDCATGYHKDAHNVFYNSTSSCVINAPAAPSITVCKTATSATSCAGLTTHNVLTWSNTNLVTVPSSAGATYYQFTASGATTEVTTPKKQSYRNVQASGTSNITWYACNDGGCSDGTLVTVHVDKEAPTIENINCIIENKAFNDCGGTKACYKSQVIVSDSLSGVGGITAHAVNNWAGDAWFDLDGRGQPRTGVIGVTYTNKGDYVTIAIEKACDIAGNCSSRGGQTCTNP